MTRTVATTWIGPHRLDNRLDARAFKPWVLSEIDKCAKFSPGALALGGKPECVFIARGLGSSGASPSSVAVYKAKEVGEFFIDEPEAFTSECLEAKVLRYGDVALTSSGIGTIGRAAIFDEFSPKGAARVATVDNHVSIIRLKGERLLPHYVCAFLNARPGKAWSEWGTTGSTRLLELPIGNVARFQVPAPHRQVQQYIGAKVALANRCRSQARKLWRDANSTLATLLGIELSPATFSVNSPDDVSGPGYDVVSIAPPIMRVSADRIGLFMGAHFFRPRRTKALLLLQQSGCKTAKLADFADRVNDRISAAELRLRGLPYLGLANIDSTNGCLKEYAEDIDGTCAYFTAGDILFSKLRPYLNKVTICPPSIPAAGGSTELVVYRPRPQLDSAFLLFVLRSLLVQHQVIDITSGLTHPRVNPEFIDNVLIPILTESACLEIGELARRSLALHEQAQALAAGAKADIGALIEGSLDVPAILCGQLRPPTYDVVLQAMASEEAR